MGYPELGAERQVEVKVNGRVRHIGQEKSHIEEYKLDVLGGCEWSSQRLGEPDTQMAFG